MPFHRQRLADHPAGVLREAAQLVPNWNSIGMPVTTPTAKLMPKMRDPESRGVGVALVAGRRPARLQYDDEQGQPHRELRKQIVVDDREGELQPVPKEGIAEKVPWALGYTLIVVRANIPMLTGSSVSHSWP